MKRFFFRHYVSLVFLIAVCCQTSAIAESLLISTDAVGFAEVSLNKTDPGMSWMINQWLKVPRSNSIKSFMQKYNAEKVISAVYTNPKTGELRFVVVEQ